MKRVFWISLLCIFFRIGAYAQYQPDCLGDDYSYRTFRMPADYGGEVFATLVRKEPLPGVDKAVLYVHGYNDYFFQKELGDSVKAHGYNFYALDLRKYGRSLRADQDTFFVKDVSEYYADLDTALATMVREGNKEIVLMGHSTGGLITSLYLHDKGRSVPVTGLILNSPFLDMNMGWFLENIGVPAVSFVGKFFPGWQVQGRGLSMYGESLLKEFHGEWEYDTGWKLLYGHPIKAGWIRAIHRAQKRVWNGLDIPVPVLLLSSDKSVKEKDGWSEAYKKADIVLDVADIRKYGARLGDEVTYVAVPDGMHDLMLSGLPARTFAYRTIFDWLPARFHGEN